MEQLDPKTLTVLQLYQLKSNSLEKVIQLQAEMEVQKQNLTNIANELLARESKEKSGLKEVQDKQ